MAGTGTDLLSLQRICLTLEHQVKVPTTGLHNHDGRGTVEAAQHTSSQGSMPVSPHFSPGQA